MCFFYFHWVCCTDELFYLFIYLFIQFHCYCTCRMFKGLFVRWCLLFTFFLFTGRSSGCRWFFIVLFKAVLYFALCFSCADAFDVRTCVRWKQEEIFWKKARKLPFETNDYLQAKHFYFQTVVGIKTMTTTETFYSNNNSTIPMTAC